MLIKPWTTVDGIRAKAYPVVTDLRTIVEDSKRKRKSYHFTTTRKALIECPTICPVCNKPVESDADDMDNMGIYSPTRKRFVVMHYICSWSALLDDIFRLADRGRI